SRTQSNAEYHLGTVLVCLILASLWGVFIVYEYLPHRRDLDRQAKDKSVSKWVEALAVALLSVVYELITLIIGGDLTFAQLNVLPEPLDTASVIIPLVALFLTCVVYRTLLRSMSTSS
ncbi:hypothetical protein FOL47_001803, partial [Perkinsus chesapeaki]